MLDYIDEMAMSQAKDTTIASALGWNTESFRRQFRERTEQKRALGKLEILKSQRDKCKAKDTTMLIWSGKQHLGQSDKAAIEHGVSDSLGALIGEINGCRHLPAAVATQGDD